jgi:hypothetical protein
MDYAIYMVHRFRRRSQMTSTFDPEVDETRRTWEVPKRGLAEFEALFGE